MKMTANQERLDKVLERVDWAITKLRKIRRVATGGDEVQEYDFVELREIIDTLRHNCQMLGEGK